MDVIEALLEALEAQAVLGARATRADRSRRSACPEWSVAELANHSLGVTLKFVEFASGATVHPRTPAGDLVGDHLDRALRSAVDAARSAWTRADRSRQCHLPFGTFSSDLAAGINLVDVLAHGWDMGTLGGSVFACPDEVWAVGLTMARAYLGTARDGSHFGPEVTIGPSASPEERFLGFVGRG